MSNELAVINQEMSLQDTMQLGDVLAKSGFFQDSRDAAQAIVKILAGRELGFGPVASMTGVNVIKGKVALSANLIAASVKRSGRYNYRVTQMTNDACAIDFYEGGEKIGTSEFTAADAKAAGLSGDNWRKYPRNMLFARAMSNGAKWFCPDLSGGPLYTPDELGAEVDGESGEMIDITPAPATGKPPQTATPREKLTYTQLKEKFNAFCGAMEERGVYVDGESGDRLPAKMHKAGNKTPQIIAATITKLLGGDADAYHNALLNLTGKSSANDLTAIEVAGIFKILFNGADHISFETPVIDTAFQDFTVIAKQDDIPF